MIERYEWHHFRDSDGSNDMEEDVPHHENNNAKDGVVTVRARWQWGAS